VGINTGTPTHTLQLGDDDAAKTTTTTWTTTSDQRIKTNIVDADLSICYDTMKKLKLRRFTWDPTYFPNIVDKNSIGFIANEVKEIFPKAVQTIPKEIINNIELDNLLTLNIDQINKATIGALQKVIEDKEKIEKKLEENDTTQIWKTVSTDIINGKGEFNMILPYSFQQDYCISLTPNEPCFVFYKNRTTTGFTVKIANAQDITTVDVDILVTGKKEINSN